LCINKQYLSVLDKNQDKKKYFFSEGEEVAHKENIQQKMFIESILFTTYEKPTGKDKSDGNIEKKITRKIIGIKCHWWDNKGYHEGKFHKTELVPWVIAEGSTYSDIIQWLAENNWT